MKKRQLGALLVCAASLLCRELAAENESGAVLYECSFEDCANACVPDGVYLDERPRVQRALRTEENFRSSPEYSYHGKKSLQMSSLQDGWEMWAVLDCFRISPQYGDYLYLEPGKPYTFSVWAKAEKENTPVKILFLDKEKRFTAGPGWSRLAVTETPVKKSKAAAQFRVMTKAKVWFDAAQLAEGGSPLPFGVETPVCWNPARAAAPEKKHPAVKITAAVKPPLIDGIFNDQCWENAEKFIIPGQLKDGKDNTEFMMAADSENLYFAIRCGEPEMGKILESHTERDDIWGDDLAEIFIHPVLSRSRYYHFAVNPKGVKAEEACDMYGRNSGYNPGWDVKTQKGKDYWQTEIRIPFSELGGPGLALAAADSWGINVCRSMAHKKVFAAWGGKYHAANTFPQVCGIKPDPDVSLLSINSVTAVYGDNPETVIMTVKLRNTGGKTADVRISVKTGAGTVESEPFTVAGREFKSVALPVKIAAGDNNAEYTVSAVDPKTGKVCRSSSGRLSLELELGPLLQHMVYTPNDKKMRCLIKTGNFINIKDCKINLRVIRADKVSSMWSKTDEQCFSAALSLETGDIETEIPLDNMEYGAYFLNTEFLAGQKSFLRKTLIFSYCPPPPDGGSFVRADRFRRVLEVNGKPLVGLDSLMASERDGTSEWLKSLTDKNIRIFTAFHFGIADEMETAKLLDACAANNSLVNIDLTARIRFSKYTEHIRKSRGMSYPDTLAGLGELVKKFRSHPALLGWKILDEPNAEEESNIAFSLTVKELIKTLDPYHPVYFAQNHGAVKLRPWLEVTEDLVSMDHYPAVGVNPPGSAGSGVFNDALGVRRIAPWSPLEYWIESWVNVNREPTPEEFMSMSYQAIVNGASIISPFVYRPLAPELFSAWGTLQREMTELKPALSAREYSLLNHEPEDNFAAAFFREGNDAWIVALNMSDKPVDAKISLPEKLRSLNTSATVMFEGRAVKIENGRLNDSFKVNERHVCHFKVK